jgi:D-lactate dehydrogenase
MIMKTLFYSTKDFELPYLQAANKNNDEVVFINEALSIASAEKAKGYDAISIFTGDDASAGVLEILHSNGVAYIATRAAGFDNIDIRKAAALGITVANVPEYSPFAIAEHAVAMIMALNRKIITADKQVHQQNFTTGNLVGFDLNNKIVGIIGVGRIGSVVAKIMHGFGCQVLGYDLQENAMLKEQYGLKYVNLVTLCLEADIITIHTGLTPQTKYLVNKKLISLMQPGVMLINTGRGGCVNTADVIEGLEKRQIGSYGADVYEKEKGVFFYDRTGEELKDEMLSTLLAMPNVLITPHQAFATKEALTNIATTTFYNLGRWSKRQYSKNELNIN